MGKLAFELLYYGYYKKWIVDKCLLASVHQRAAGILGDFLA